MAYGNYIASIPFRQIDEIRRDPATLLLPSIIAEVSHLLAYWVTAQPLGKLLGEALDGGQPLSEDLWHPLRPPVAHSPVEVSRLLTAITEALPAVGTGDPVKEVEWFRSDIDSLLAVFRHAVELGEGIVSVLTPPIDPERSARVRIPFASGST